MADFDEDAFQRSLEIYRNTQRSNHPEEHFDEDAFSAALEKNRSGWKEGLKGKYEPQLGQAPKGYLPPVPFSAAAKTMIEQGLTLGGADELNRAAHAPNALTPLYKTARGIPDAPYAGIEADRQDIANAEASYPIAAPVTEMIASLPTGMALGGPITANKGLLRGLFSASRAGSTVGGVYGYNASEAPSVGGNLWDAAKSGLAGGVLGPLFYGVGALATRLSPAGRAAAAEANVNKTLNTLGEYEGVPNKTVASAQEVAGPGARVPLQTLENAGNRITLQKMFKQPKISRLSGEGEANISDAVAQAEEASGAATQAAREAKLAVGAEKAAYQDSLINSRNAQRETVRDFNIANEESGFGTRTANQEQAAKYNMSVAEQDAAFAAERSAYEAQRAADRSSYAEAKTSFEGERAANAREYTSNVEDYNAQKARELADYRAAQNEVSDLRHSRASRAVDQKNQYLTDSEERALAIEEARTTRNQEIRNIRESDPELDVALAKGKAKELPNILDKHMGPDDARRLDLNAAFENLKQAREPIPKPRIEAPIPSAARSTDVTPRPVREALGPKPVAPASGPKPTSPAKPAKPAKQPTPAKQVPPAYQEPNAKGLQAARQNAEVTKQKADIAGDKAAEVQALAKDLDKALNRVRGAKRGLQDFLNPAKAAKAVKALLIDDRTAKKILSNPEKYNRLMDLAAQGKRLKPNTPAVDVWTSALNTFAADLQDSGQ